MEKYKILERLGEGAFGKVYKALNKSTGEVVAIKKFEQKYKTWDECLELREIKALQKLKHPNITKLREVLQSGEELFLVFQYLEVNLFELYSKRKKKSEPYTEKEIKSFVYQVVEGLAHMHKRGFFHRDMKPENLLILGSVIKLCDFGLAREIRSLPPFTQYVSTRWYRAPQLLLGSTNYNSPVDIFALGCIMAELYTFNPLFPGANAIDQMNKIVAVLGAPDQENWPDGYKLAKKRGYYFPGERKQDFSKLIPSASSEALQLIQATLQYNPKKRPTAHELLKHPYFSGVTNIATESQEHKKEVVIFDRNIEAKPIDTEKADKKHEFMKLTKEKFFRDTKQKWKDNHKSPTKEREREGEREKKKEDEDEDLEQILKQLEREQEEKKSKLRSSTKQAASRQNIELRESKTQMGPVNSYKHELRPEKEPWVKKNFDEGESEPPLSVQKRDKDDITGQLLNKKLNYSFQPAPLFPFALKPVSKFESYSNRGQGFKLPSHSSNLAPSHFPSPSFPSYPSHNPLQRNNMFKERAEGMPIVLKARSEMHQKYKF